jgi:hypothetical protein
MAEDNEKTEELVLELYHEETIKEEIEKGTLKSAADLPEKIKKQIKGLNLQIGKFKTKPTETLKDSIEKKSGEISDDIINFVEEGLEEPEADDKKPKEPTEEEKQKAAANATAEAEKKILEKIKADGKIYSKDLAKILGVDSIEDIDDRCKIGNTTLERSLGYYYKVDG